MGLFHKIPSALSILLSVVCLNVTSHADDNLPPLNTDRPTQTAAPVIVPVHFTQVEFGWIHSYTKFGKTTYAPVGVPEYETTRDVFLQSLVRYGLSRRVEMRVAWGGLIAEEAKYPAYYDENGQGNLDVGAKILLTEESPDNAGVGSALLFDLMLPTGDDLLARDIYQLTSTALLSKQLSSKSSLTANAGISAVAPFADWEVYFNGAVTLGVTLANRVAGFVDVFGQRRIDETSKWDNWLALDGGLTLGLGNNAQLDVSAGSGLTEFAFDWFIGLGASIRFGS